jgi:hypothetical protein
MSAYRFNRTGDAALLSTLDNYPVPHLFHFFAKGWDTADLLRSL